MQIYNNNGVNIAFSREHGGTHEARALTRASPLSDVTLSVERSGLGPGHALHSTTTPLLRTIAASLTHQTDTTDTNNIP